MASSPLFSSQKGFQGPWNADRPKRWLVCFDGSPSSLLAVKHAAVMAKPHDWLYLMTVSTKPVHEMKEVWINANNLITEAEPTVRQFLRQFDHPPLFRSFIRVNPNPSNEILDFSVMNNCDYIVMGARGLSGLKAMWLGSVSTFVVQNATIPVLIVRGNDHAHPRDETHTGGVE